LKKRELKNRTGHRKRVYLKVCLTGTKKQKGKNKKSDRLKGPASRPPRPEEKRKVRNSPKNPEGDGLEREERITAARSPLQLREGNIL